MASTASTADEDADASDDASSADSGSATAETGDYALRLVLACLVVSMLATGIATAAWALRRKLDGAHSLPAPHTGAK